MPSDEPRPSPGFARASLFGSRARRKKLGLAGMVLLPLVLACGWVRCGPFPEDLLRGADTSSTRITDRRGIALYESSSGGERRASLSPEALPEVLVGATLAAEDRRFFSHPGVDPLALSRATLRNLLAWRKKEGGSTLTQQVVKRLTGRPRTLRGKLSELILALRLEHRMTKREILALYLNLAPYGNQYSGAEAASRGYFGCPAENLTPAQAAFLAGLPQRPTALDPYRHMDRALARQREVLRRMRRCGRIDAAAYGRALKERLRLARGPREFCAPHFVERVRGAFGTGPPPRRIVTTLDASIQEKVVGILAASRRTLEKHDAHNVAVVVLHNPTGEWLAWEGSGDYFDAEHSGAIDGAMTPRQPGSALKPLLYALAFEQGYTPASVLPDIPAYYPTKDEGVAYGPRNYDGVFRGPLRARLALGGSENVPAVWMLSRVGVPGFLDRLRRCGLTGLDKVADYYGYGLALGDAEVRLAELVSAYSILARGGVAVPPRSVLRTEWPGGRVEATEAPTPQRVFSERASFWVADILSDPWARAYAFGTGGSLDFPFPVAAKTGTSQAYRDNWTVGFTSLVTVGVWVGNFDRSELIRSSGITGAGPIFHQVMLAAEASVRGGLPGEEEATLPRVPAGVVPSQICCLSGLGATGACPEQATEWLEEGRAPVPCTWHRGTGSGMTTDWPSEYRAWALERGLLRPSEPGPERGPASARAIEIRNPPPGAVYLIDPTLRPEFQTLPFRALAGGQARAITWSVDGAVVGSCSSDGEFSWPLRRGAHRVTARDGAGRTASAEILVK